MRRRHEPYALIPFCAAFALYIRSIGFGFVQADDTHLILGNAAFFSDPSNLPRTFVRSFFESELVLTDLATYYRPLAIASFMLDAQIGGSDPAMYHFVNVVLHGAVATSLFWVLLLMGASNVTALLVSLIFGVHPANVSSVCWVMGRNELLLAGFSLAALASFITYWRNGSRVALAVHVLMFAGALFSKESSLALMPLVLLYPWLWESTGGNVQLKPEAATTWMTPARRRLAAATALELLVALAWWRLRTVALSTGAAAVEGPWWQTFIANVPQLLVYLEKISFPFRLTTMPALDTAGIVLGLVAGCLLSVTLMVMLGMKRFCFVAAWFFGFLTPAFLIPSLPAYEHRLYVPLLGVAIGFSALKLDSGSWRQTARQYAAAAIIVVFALASFRYSETFRNPLTYWGRATEGSSFAPIAHVNVGQILMDIENTEDAAAHFRRALELEPRTPRAHNNLGVALMRLGRPTEALDAFMRELALHPSSADAQYNLGLYYKLEGKTAQAVEHWERAIAVNRYYLPAYEQLASYYTSSGDVAKAAWYAGELHALRNW